jgi:uncharacterized membrane protein
MQFFDQLLQFLEQVLSVVFHFVEILWEWSFQQILNVRLDHIQYLPYYKITIIVITWLTVIYFLFRSAREFLDVGERALSAFAALLSVIIRALPSILLAGGAAAIGAWALQNLNF